MSFPSFSCFLISFKLTLTERITQNRLVTSFKMEASTLSYILSLFYSDLSFPATYFSLLFAQRMNLTSIGSEGKKDHANPFEPSVLRLRLLQPYAPLRFNPERERVCGTYLARRAIREPFESHSRSRNDMIPLKDPLLCDFHRLFQDFTQRIATAIRAPANRNCRTMLMIIQFAVTRFAP